MMCQTTYSHIILKIRFNFIHSLFDMYKNYKLKSYYIIILMWGVKTCQLCML